MSEGPDVWRMLLTDANEFHVPEEFREILRQAGVHVESVDGHEPTAIAAAGERCHGLFLYRARVDDALLAALPACRLLARVGTGYDAIDVEAARRRGVMVTYVPDFCTEELSDHVMACILGFTRQFPFILSRARDHRWLTIAEVPVQRRLRGRTLGILGFGRSGQRTAEKARAFGLDALAWTRTPRPADLARAGARRDVRGGAGVRLCLAAPAADGGDPRPDRARGAGPDAAGRGAGQYRARGNRGHRRAGGRPARGPPRGCRAGRGPAGTATARAPAVVDPQRVDYFAHGRHLCRSRGRRVVYRGRGCDTRAQRTPARACGPRATGRGHNDNRAWRPTPTRRLAEPIAQSAWGEGEGLSAAAARRPLRYSAAHRCSLD